MTAFDAFALVFGMMGLIAIVTVTVVNACESRALRRRGKTNTVYYRFPYNPPTTDLSDKPMHPLPDDYMGPYR